MKNEITYTEINSINYPNLCLPGQPNVNIGKYGQMRLDFLKKYRRGTYTTLLTEGRLAAQLVCCRPRSALTSRISDRRVSQEARHRRKPQSEQYASVGARNEQL